MTTNTLKRIIPAAALFIALPVGAFAATYAYVDTSGNVRSTEAPSPQQAIATAPAIGIHSGVILLDGSSLEDDLGGGGTVDDTDDMNTDDDNTVTINVMNHICDEDTQTVDEFDSFDGPDDNDTTDFHDKVLNCPTVVLDGDSYVDGTVHFPETRDFNFTVTGDDGEEMTISDAEFMPMKLCETDVDFDVNGDGDIDAGTCLETSMYSFEGVAGGNVTVTESETPGDVRAGALEFTPDALMENDDADTLVDEDVDDVFSDGDMTLMLDTDEDSQDNVVTLHIYNFVND